MSNWIIFLSMIATWVVISFVEAYKFMSVQELKDNPIIDGDSASTKGKAIISYHGWRMVFTGLWLGTVVLLAYVDVKLVYILSGFLIGNVAYEKIVYWLVRYDLGLSLKKVLTDRKADWTWEFFGFEVTIKMYAIYDYVMVAIAIIMLLIWG